MGEEKGIEEIRNGKKIVMMNVEEDVKIGKYIKEKEEKKGVIY